MLAVINNVPGITRFVSTHQDSSHTVMHGSCTINKPRPYGWLKAGDSARRTTPRRCRARHQKRRSWDTHQIAKSPLGNLRASAAFHFGRNGRRRSSVRRSTPRSSIDSVLVLGLSALDGCQILVADILPSNLRQLSCQHRPRECRFDSLVTSHRYRGRTRRCLRVRRLLSVPFVCGRSPQARYGYV